MAPEVDPPTTAAAPRHLIGLVPCVALAVGSMVGGGVFTMSGTAIGEAGSGAVLSYVLAGAVMLLSALCFVVVAARATPGQSGYAPVSGLLGPVWRFVVMWAFYLAGATSVTFMVVSFGDYFTAYFATALDSSLVAVVAAVAVTAINLGPVDAVAKAQTWVVVLKIGLLVLFVGWGLTALPELAAAPPPPDGASDVLVATAFLFTAFTGFNVVTNIAGSVREPARTVPRAVLLAIAVCVVTYVGVVLAMLASGVRVFGPAGVSEAAEALMGPWGAYVIAVTACVSTATGAIAMMLATSELVLRMAERGDLPAAAARTSRTGHPLVSVVVLGGVAAALALVTDIRALVELASAATILAMVVVDVAAVVLAVRGWPGDGMRLPGGPTIPVLATVATVAQLPSLGLAHVLTSLALVAAGLVVYARRADGRGEHVRTALRETIERLETPLLRAVRRPAPAAGAPVADGSE